MATEQTRDLQSVYDSDEAITQEVLTRFALTPDPRLREVVTSLITHLHGWARDVRLTWSEWERAIEFLTKSAAFCKGGRNEFIALSDAIGLTMLVTATTQATPGATIPTLVGPFFVPGAPRYPNGADISNGAQGTPLFVSGRVLDLDNRPISGAVLDVWHSDDRGLYDVQDGLEKKGMWARGQLVSDPDGRYSFWSIMPTHYPVPTDGGLGELIAHTTMRHYRPAHLHCRLQAEGFEDLVTHIFVRGSEYLDEDAVFGVRPGLVADYPRHEPGRAPDGRQMDRPYHTLAWDFILPKKAAA